MIHFSETSLHQATPLYGTYDPYLVLLSYVVAFLSAFAGLLMCDRIGSADRRGSWLGWLALGSLVMGFGVWAMHFIGMLAFVLPIDFTYDVALTMVSVVPAILASACVLIVLSRRRQNLWLYVLAGTSLGLGVGAMHYTGMAAMKIAAGMRYDPSLFILSILFSAALGIGAVFARLWGDRVFGNERLILNCAVAASVVGLAIAGMHYIAMEATELYVIPGVTGHTPSPSLHQSWLASGVTIISILIMCSAIAAIIQGRQLQKREQLLRRTNEQLIETSDAIEAMNDGFMLLNEHQHFLMFNSAFMKMTGYSAEELKGQTPGLLNLIQQDEALREEMAASLRSSGSWEGEIRTARKNGEGYPAWLKVNAITARKGRQTQYVATLADITSRKAAEERNRHLAFHDPLTQLPNRRLIIDRLQHAMSSSLRSGRKVALAFIDLDDFKTLNDTLGHDKGDLLLRKVARRLLKCMREGDTVGRLGGDEFVLVLEDLDERPTEAASQVEAVGEKVLESLSQPFDLGTIQHYITASVGVTLFTNPDTSVNELVKQADLAMYQSKAAGRNRVSFFDSSMQAAVNARMSLEAQMRDGIKRQEFSLYYQAQVDNEGRLLGAEALIRWLHPRRGMVYPGDFIPLAEDTGLIVDLGYWVLQCACEQLRAWSARPATAGLHISVNISPHLFHQKDFVTQVLKILDLTQTNPHNLTLEITESVLLEDMEEITDKMNALKSQGIGFSLDDFGTGYSSLRYLKLLPIDQLKVDQSFVRDALTDPNDAAIVRTIIALAQSLDLHPLAEGVETRAQMTFLQSLGCQAYQGHFFGYPEPAETLINRHFVQQG